MATKAKTLQVKDKEKDDKAADAPEKDSADAPSPLLDLSDAAVKKMIKQAKKRGFVTFDQLNEVLPSDTTSPEQIEDIMSMLSDMGINVSEAEEADSEEDNKEEAEDETAIAKRIEAGREAMIAGLCESPLTFQAIIIWRDELNEGKIFLRDIIDLDATYAGPDARAMSAPVIGPDGRSMVDIAVPGQPSQPPHMLAPATAPATAISFKTTDERADREVTAAHGTISESNPDDDDDMENWLSVAAIEAELKPKVIETFDAVAGAYKRLRRLQDKDIQFQLKRLSISPAPERKYKKLKNEIIGEVKSLRLNRARIDALVEQLYDINKRLVGYEGN